MNYNQTLEYIYEKLPCYQHIGKAAYKTDLHNIVELLQAIGNPHKTIRTIHVAGTNGKGSTSHILASIFQESNFVTGLYTSPHLLDFRERICVNGQMIEKAYVSNFISQNTEIIERIQPSFFEITVALCFWYFHKKNVDIAIIETGLGGRLDSTNVIHPLISIITNVSKDHTHILGDTIEKIATEKAGIIKHSTPIIIGESTPETEEIFIREAESKQAPIIFAHKEYTLHSSHENEWHKNFAIQHKNIDIYKNITTELTGEYQKKNMCTVIAAIEALRTKGIRMNKTTIQNGIKRSQTHAPIAGRWQIFNTKPTIILDTAHNESGVQHAMQQLVALRPAQLYIIWGMVQDKDVESILPLLPASAHYLLVKPTVDRGLDQLILQEHCNKHNLTTTAYSTISDAYKSVKQKLQANDVLYIGGSTFVVADFLKNHKKF